MNTKATAGPAKARLLPAAMALIAALVLAAGLTLPQARAAIDFASNVGVQIVARPGSASGSEQDFELRNGGVLRSGDGVQLRLESDVDAYVYVVAYGSSHTAILLHPFSGRSQDARMQPGQVEVIPESGVFLPLDNREGLEALFTIVSQAPLADITDLLPRIEAHGEDLGAITAMIGAAYPGMRRLTFKHIGARPLVGVAAIAPRAVSSGFATSPASAPRADDAGADRIGGATVPAPGDAGWAVPSSGGFGVSGAAAGGATAASGASAAPAASPPAVPAAGAAMASAAAAKAEADPVPASSALRRAREAAGIDESEFRGILATLPARGQAAVPASVRGPYEEQGVLSAEGSRIRPLGRAELDSGAGSRSQN